jgi:hypothetical protein
MSAGTVVAYGSATCEPSRAYDPILEAIAELAALISDHLLK